MDRDDRHPHINELRALLHAHRGHRRLVGLMAACIAMLTIIAVLAGSPVLLTPVLALSILLGWVVHRHDVTPSRGRHLRRLLIEVERRAAPDTWIGSKGDRG